MAVVTTLNKEDYTRAKRYFSNRGTKQRCEDEGGPDRGTITRILNNKGRGEEPTLNKVMAHVDKYAPVPVEENTAA